MDTQYKTAWLTALRSGEYRQARNTLASIGVDYPEEEQTHERFCCLGVFCEVMDKQFHDKWEEMLAATKLKYEKRDHTTDGRRAFMHDTSSHIEYCVTTGSIPDLIAAKLNIRPGFLSKAIELNDTCKYDFAQIAKWAESIDEATFEMPDFDDSGE